MALDDVFATPDIQTNESLTTTQDLLSWLYTVSASYTTNDDNQGLQGLLGELLTYPVLVFQANYDFNTIAPAVSRISGLPLDLYVNVSRAQSVDRLIIARWTVVFFVLGTSIMYGLCISVLCWARIRNELELGSIALVTFGSMLCAGERANDSFATVLANLPHGGKMGENLEGKTIRLRHENAGYSLQAEETTSCLHPD
jgi:hypothetical protein